MKDFGTTILACTPSYALYMAEVMEELGIKKEDLKLKAGVFGAEQWSENMRKEIEERLGIIAIDIYGLSEVIGPGVSTECYCKCGLHVQEDHFIPEIIDPETGEVLPPGSKGELIDRIESGYIKDCSIVTVVSSKPNVYALERAKKHNIPAVCIARKIILRCMNTGSADTAF